METKIMKKDLIVKYLNLRVKQQELKKYLNGIIDNIVNIKPFWQFQKHDLGKKQTIEYSKKFPNKFNVIRWIENEKWNPQNDAMNIYYNIDFLGNNLSELFNFLIKGREDDEISFSQENFSIDQMFKLNKNLKPINAFKTEKELLSFVKKKYPNLEI